MRLRTCAESWTIVCQHDRLAAITTMLPPRRANLILAGLLLLALVADSEEDGSGLLTRRKRYVVFPEGSSFSIALCMTVHTLTPDNIFTEGLNWGISYDLPNESKPELAPFLQLRNDRVKVSSQEQQQQQQQYEARQPPPEYQLQPGANKYYKADYHYLQRRHRRDLYNKVELIIDAMGLDGRSCILRALCEASQRFAPKGNSLLEEMMRIVFALPLKRLYSFEPPEHHAYANAHRAGREGQDCLDMFPSCGFSLIDMALGKYNAPDDHYSQMPLDLRYAMK